jgi:cobaltochelatase CobT
MQERQRPSAVGLSIDLSGSMRGDKMRTVMCSSYLLADALDKAGVRFGAYGWSDTATGEDNQGLEFLSETEEKGYSSCRTRGLKHLKFKGFDEPLRKVKDRFSYLHAIRYTPMAEGMWYTAQKLLARPEERKILVVFGDGEPSKMTPYEDPIENVRSVIEKCESMGIEVILIGIMDKAMEEIRKDLTVRVRDIKQLQKTLFSEVYKKLKNNTKTVRRGQHVKN